MPVFREASHKKDNNYQKRREQRKINKNNYENTTKESYLLHCMLVENKTKQTTTLSEWLVDRWEVVSAIIGSSSKRRYTGPRNSTVDTRKR